MAVSPIAQQTIDINRASMQTSLDIATAVAAKQAKVAKETGQAVVDLIQPIAQPSTPSRGIDVRA
jgi:hypothetical protein